MEKSLSIDSTYSTESPRQKKTDESKVLSLTHKKRERKTKKKKVIQSQKSFKYRNLIKKLKTHCIKIFEKIIKTCLIYPHTFSLYNIKPKQSRLFFRYFKSDISKQKNKILMNTQLKYLLSKFIGNASFSKLEIKSEMEALFNYLTNIKWKQFLLLFKYDPNSILLPYIINNFVLINPNNLNILYDYIYSEEENTSNCAKRTINAEYQAFINAIPSQNEDSTDLNDYAITSNLKSFLINFRAFN